MSPDQLLCFNYCQYMRCVEDFDRYTNVRRLVIAEIREYLLSTKQLVNLFKEIAHVDRHIEYIFGEFLSISDAWCCTLLKDVRMEPEFMQSDLFVYDVMEMKRARVCVKVRFSGFVVSFMRLRLVLCLFVFLAFAYRT